MKPKGNTRKLIIYLGDIQDLIGEASAHATNDRDTMRMDKLLPALEEAFDLCVEARDMYDPIEGSMRQAKP